MALERSLIDQIRTPDDLFGILNNLVKSYENDLTGNEVFPFPREQFRSSSGGDSPPIVWFPSEPECPTSTGSGAFGGSFQMIAFLLSVFNIAAMVSVSAMDANANNNNNNNNRNDNSANGNEANINEGNTNADVNAMNQVGRG